MSGAAIIWHETQDFAGVVLYLDNLKIEFTGLSVAFELDDSHVANPLWICTR